MEAVRVAREANDLEAIAICLRASEELEKEAPPASSNLCMVLASQAICLEGLGRFAEAATTKERWAKAVAATKNRLEYKTEG